MSDVRIDVLAWRAARPAARRALRVHVPFLHRRLAARAVRDLLPVGSLSAVHVAELIARGTTVVAGSRLIAVEDEDSVVLSTAPGPGEGPQIPLATVVQIGNDGWF
jgi:hypothetical protein